MRPVASRMPRVPWPPLLLLIALAGGAALQRAAPLEAPVPPAVARALSVLGWSLVAAALALELFLVSRFVRARTTVLPNRAATTLLTSGPYRWSRNPIYVAHVALVLGFGLARANPYTTLSAAVVAVLLDRLAIRREEAFLAARFGDVYGAYRARVRRWL